MFDKEPAVSNVDSFLGQIRRNQYRFPGQVLSLIFLFLDRSGSMQEFGDEPQRAANGFLDELRQADKTGTMAVEIVCITDEPEVTVPLAPLKDIKPISDYFAEGGTPLYATLNRWLKQILKATAQGLPDDIRLEVTLAVITDGQNDPDMRPDKPSPAIELRSLSKLARQQGWKLLTLGLGLDAKEIALDMGFPIDGAHARTLKRQARSLGDSMRFVLDSVVRTRIGPARPSVQIAWPAPAPSSH